MVFPIMIYANHHPLHEVSYIAGLSQDATPPPGCARQGAIIYRNVFSSRQLMKGGGGAHELPQL